MLRGDTLTCNGQRIGRVTSSTWSPYQVCGVGIVHLNDADLGPGAVVDVQCTDGTLHKGELCTLPMYDPEGKIVRGKSRCIPQNPVPWKGIAARSDCQGNTDAAGA